GELPIVFIEGGALPALDVEDADHAIVQRERNGQAALGLIEAKDIARIALDIGADVGAPGRGDISADAVAFGIGIEVDVQRIIRQAGADDHLELIRPAIEQANRKVIEVHQLFGEGDDLLFKELEALPHVQFAQGFRFQADQLAAGAIDGVDFLLESASTRGIPYNRDHLHDLTSRVDHGRGDQLQELLVVDIQNVTLGSAEGGRVGMLLRGLLAEEAEGFLTGPADLFVNPRGPGLHLLVHPVTAGLVIDNADAFADGVENQVGLLGNKSALERKEVGRVGKDRTELIVTKSLDGLIDRGNLHDFAGDSKRIDRLRVSRRSVGQDQNFVAFTVQRIGSQPATPLLAYSSFYHRSSTRNRWSTCAHCRREEGSAPKYHLSYDISGDWIVRFNKHLLYIYPCNQPAIMPRHAAGQECENIRARRHRDHRWCT